MERVIPSPKVIITYTERSYKYMDTIFYNTKDVARLLGCSIQTAREVMYRKDFPLIRVGKNLKVQKTAFETWASERRV